MRPLTSTKLVMAGAAMTLGSRPRKTQRNGMQAPSEEAIVDTRGNVQKMTTETCNEIPMI